jgi:hypothetical protein
MSLLPLPFHTLAWLNHAADAGQRGARVMLHLIARADKRDRDVAEFVDSYSSTIAALCRRLEALERGANDLPAPAAPVDAAPVVNALLQAESALADVAENGGLARHAGAPCQRQCCPLWDRRMTMPDQIQIIHQPRTMTTPRTALTSDDIPPGPFSEDDLRQKWNQQADQYNQWESLDSCEQLAWAQALAIRADRHAAALKAESEGEGPSAADLLPVEPPNIPSRHALRYCIAWREGVEDGWSEARAILARRGHPPAAAPALEVVAEPSLADVDELCAEFGFHYDNDQGETLEMLRDMISASLARWGPPSAAAPEPGENLATPPAPEPGEAARLTYLDAIRLAQGCHDYSGGYSGAEGEAWHGAIDTVVDVLKRAAVGPWDGQLKAVYGVGVEAQAGEVAELDDQHREAVHQAVAEALGGAYDCQRVWEAWGVGTMGPDDFVPVAEDSDRVAEIADAAIEAIRAIPLPAPQAGEVALAGDRRSAELLQLPHESCRLLGTKNGDCPDSETCWLDMLPCSHYENCATLAPDPQC